MGAMVCTWSLVVALLCGTSHAFFNNVRPPNCFPRYESCRETIEDLKSLLEITQSMKPDTTNICPKCNSAISEEVIMKLVNALIFTATQNCGFTGKGNSGYPINGGGVAGNAGHVSGGGSAGGLVGGNNGGYPVGGGSGGTKSNDDPLVGVNIGGKNTLGVDVAGQPILGVDVGSQSGSRSNGAQPAGVTATGGQSSDDPLLGVKLLDEKELLDVNLGKDKLVGVKLGSSHDNEETTYGTSHGVTHGTTPSATGPLGGVPNGALGDVTDGVPSGVNNGLGGDKGKGGATHGVLGGNSPVSSGALVPAPSSRSGSAANKTPISTSTATNQIAGAPQDSGKAGATNTAINQPITSVPTIAGGGTAPGPGTAGIAPVNEVNSGNTSTDQNKATTVNVINKPTDAAKGVQEGAHAPA